MNEITVLQQRLTEAEDAYRLLMTGQQEVTVSIGGYGTVTYTTTNMSQLERHIANLKAIIARQSGRGGRRAMFVEF